MVTLPTSLGGGSHLSLCFGFLFGFPYSSSLLSSSAMYLSEIDGHLMDTDFTLCVQDVLPVLGKYIVTHGRNT